MFLTFLVTFLLTYVSVMIINKTRLSSMSLSRKTRKLFFLHACWLQKPLIWHLIFSSTIAQYLTLPQFLRHKLNLLLVTTLLPAQWRVSVTSFRCFYRKHWAYVTPFSSASIVSFEQVNVCRDISYWRQFEFQVNWFTHHPFFKDLMKTLPRLKRISVPLWRDYYFNLLIQPIHPL